MRAVVIAMIVLFLCNGVCLGDDKGIASEQDKSTLYEYDQDNPPKIFFFPPEKARWDGYKVTMKEWYLLTDLQKEKFISEYMEQLGRQYRAAMESAGLDDYLQALNLFSYYSNDRAVNEPSVKFIDRILAGQGKIETKAR